MQGRLFEDVAAPLPIAKKIQYLTTPLGRRAFSAFLQQHRPFWTTPGVFVELYRHVCELKNHVDEVKFWTMALHEMRTTLGIAEHPHPIDEMHANNLASHGPVDEALFQLASSKPGFAIVIGERRLWNRCKDERVPCKWIHEVLVQTGAGE